MIGIMISYINTLSYIMNKLTKKRRLDTFESLQSENFLIVQELIRLQKSLTDPNSIKLTKSVLKNFKSLAQSYSTFNTKIFQSVVTNKEKAKSFQQSIEYQKTVSRKITRQKSRIKSKEVVIKSREREWQRSLGKIRGLWEKNLFEMETSLKYQKETIRRIGTSYFTTIRSIEKELQDVLEGPKVPELKLTKINNTKTPVKGSSARSSSSMKLSDEDDLISNRSAFSYVTEDLISHRSNSSRARPIVRRVNPPLPPCLPMQNSHMVNCSEINESYEFEKLMSEIEKDKKEKENPNSISMEKSMGGWKSEYESEDSVSFNLNSDEIKKALVVLKKARLLNAGNNQFLLKLAEMIKKPENSSNLELMLQLINIERKKGKVGQKSLPKAKGRGKPPTPTHVNRKRLQHDLVGTTRDKFLFPEETNKTILSIDHHFSPKEHEFLDGSSIGRFTNNDVNLEDLLNVPSYVESLGLVSADNSFCNGEEVKVQNAKNINEQPDKFPVKLKVGK